jgi:Glycosyltransferase family 87
LRSQGVLGTGRTNAVRLEGARLRSLSALAAGLVVLLMAGGSVAYLRDSLAPDRVLFKDLGQEYLLARALVEGVNPYVPMRDLAARYLEPLGYLDKPFPTPHPPTAGLLFLASLVVGYPTLVQAWFGLELVFLGLGLAWSAWAAGWRLPWRMVPVVGFALLAWFPIVIELGLGQVTLALLAGLAGAQLAILRGRVWVGGAALGLTLLLKPLAWPWLLALVARRLWPPLIGSLVVVLVGSAVCAVRLGPGVLVDYGTRVLPQVSALYADEPTNISLWTVAPRLLGQGQMPRGIAAVVPVLVALASLAWLRTRPALGHALGVLTCVSVLVNPISWGYYLVLAVMPAAQVLACLRVRGYPPLPTALAVLVAVGLYLGGGDWRALASLVAVPPLASLVTLGPAWSIGALGLLLAWMARQPGGSRCASSSAT